MKLALVAMVISLSFGTARADDLILKNSAGHPAQLSWSAAMRACPAGTHLPSAREFAVWAQAKGAKGIRELNDQSQIPPGYGLVSVIDANGKSDEFYFNPEGYRGPNEGGVKIDFWSSSSASSNSFDAAMIAYFGAFFFYPKASFGHVLCLPQR